MTLKEKIQELNRTEDAVQLKRLVERLDSGFLKTADGTPVVFDYFDMLAFFQRCDPTIDPARFDHLMYLVDTAPLTTERVVTR